MFNLSSLFLTAVVALPPLSESPAEAPSIPPWLWVLLVLILVVLPILVLLFGPRLWRKQEEAVAATPEPEAHHGPAHHEAAVEAASVVEEPVAVEEPAAAEEPVAAAEPVEVVPDDLKVVEGIGPKIAGVLQAAGILTFAQLAASEPVRLQEILDQDPRLRLADPTTWPEQARLAAAGDWEALQKLQDELKGGREE